MATTPPENPSSGHHEAAVFECNICFDIAQDPVVTICGHLHCWPCLYKWLNLHSQCPVCKTLIELDNLIPLYGRGNTTIDPTLISHQNDEIPRRPARRRPDTIPPALSRNIGLSAEMLPPVFSVRFHEVSDAWGFNYGSSIGEGGVVDRESGSDESFKRILVFILLFVIFVIF